RTEKCAGAGEDEGANAAVAACGVELGAEVGEQRLVERVGRRTVEREQAHSLRMIVAAHGRHARASSGRLEARSTTLHRLDAACWYRRRHAGARAGIHAGFVGGARGEL